MRMSLFVPLLLASLTAKDFPYPGDPPDPASPSLRSEWAKRFETATAFRVFHHGMIQRPAPFASVVSCQYEVEVQYADERIAGDSTLAVYLADAIRRTLAPAPTRKRACPETRADDWFDLWLDSGKDLVVARYWPANGSVKFFDNEKRSAYGDLGARAPELFTMLAKGLPDDLRMESIVPCAVEAETVSVREQNLKYVESLPEAKIRIQPIYPSKPLKDGEEGIVMVQALVDTTGNVSRTKLLGNASVFDESAVHAVERWIFEPATSNGRPVAVWIAVPIKFSIH